VDQVVWAGTAAGFTAAAHPLSAAAVHALLQTEFSGKIASWCLDRPGRTVFLVQATAAPVRCRVSLHRAAGAPPGTPVAVG
jgi:hypothetical protein